MKKLLDPRWIILVNTLPILLFFFLEWGEFSIIKTLLSAESITIWVNFAIALGLLAISSLAYTIVQYIRKKKIDAIYSILSLIAYTVFIYTYYNYSQEIIPWNIPSWMLSGNIHIYAGTFIMPTLIHSLFVLVILLTPHTKNLNAWINLTAAITIPALFYVFGILLSPLWNGLSGNESFHITAIFVVLVTIIFLFFLIRSIYILISKKGLNTQYQILWKIPLAFVFPIIGLLLNVSFNDMFGDFSDEWFFILAILNAIFICLPNNLIKNSIYRLLLFIGRCATFAYTFYFFLVFLPFLPLSIFAILLIGSGFLMLTPLLLFVVHLNEIVNDFKYLKQVYKSQILINSVAAVGFLILPTVVTLSYIGDRKTLYETLDYLYSPDYTKGYNLNGKSILKTIHILDEHSNNTFFYSSTPYLSSYFKWIVLDNLNLSYDKKRLMKDLFTGKEYAQAYSDTPSVGSSDIKLVDVKHTSRYDEKQQTWISWVDLSLENKGATLPNSEYITQIDLPTGCWISDYYLYVGDVKEMGILAEKKAATWVFSRIRNENRDPGMLSYQTGNRVEFKVFPFLENEVRRTGIEFIHKEAVEIEIDGYILHLGDPARKTNENVISNKEEIIYISSMEKQVLESVERTPYYHFIVDMSQPEEKSNWSDKKASPSPKERVEMYTSEISWLLNQNLINGLNAKISYTGTHVKTAELKNDWQEELKKQTFEGGFFLDRAVKKIIFDNYTNPQQDYPIIVVLTDDLNKAIYYDDINNLEFAMPEGNNLYLLKNKNLSELYCSEREISVVDSCISLFPKRTAKVWPSRSKPLMYLADNDKAEIILNTNNKIITTNTNNIKEKNWESGLLMQAQWMQQLIYPQTVDQEWLTLIQNSFKSRIMTPLTSYIVVESEAQKAMLKKKQEEVLSGKRALDLNGDTQRMSEPSLWILLMLLGGVYLIHKWRK